MGGPNQPRQYPHTAPVSTCYALRECLAVVGEEGLPEMWARHASCADELWCGLRALGLEPFVPLAEHRLVTVSTVKVPDGVDGGRLVAHALREYDLEIAGDLGPTA